MSYSSDIKSRVSHIINNCNNCDKTQLEAIILYSGRLIDNNIVLFTENNDVSECISRLITKLTGYKPSVTYTQKTRLYEIVADNTQMLEDIFNNRMFANTDDELAECCMASYIRGAFLSGGSVCDPHKSYHLEFDSRHCAEAERLKAYLEKLGIQSKITLRKKHYVVYIKEYSAICDVLGVIGASNAAFDIYNISIEKDLRNNINRQLNCENANSDKIADAYQKHLIAIDKVKKTIGIDKLPEVLQEIINVRLEYPEDSLSMLGQRLEKPIGKSGVNHRLNRIVEIAEQL